MLLVQFFAVDRFDIRDTFYCLLSLRLLKSVACRRSLVGMRELVVCNIGWVPGELTASLVNARVGPSTLFLCLLATGNRQLIMRKFHSFASIRKNDFEV